jgi:hypothetical protein
MNSEQYPLMHAPPFVAVVARKRTVRSETTSPRSMLPTGKIMMRRNFSEPATKPTDVARCEGFA